MQIYALYVSVWAEGEVISTAAICTTTFSVTNINVSDDGDDYEHHKHDYIQVEHNGMYTTFECEDGDLTPEGKKQFEQFVTANLSDIIPTTKPKILLANIEPTTSNDKCRSLYVNDTHILTTEDDDVPIDEVAQSLATAFETELEIFSISTEQLATSIVNHDPMLKSDFDSDMASGEIDFSEWASGYNNTDVLRAIKNIQTKANS